MKSNTLGKILMYNINNTYMYKTKELVHESSQNAENQCSPRVLRAVMTSLLQL